MKCTYLDHSYAVNELCRYISNPSKRLLEGINNGSKVFELISKLWSALK